MLRILNRDMVQADFFYKADIYTLMILIILGVVVGLCLLYYIYTRYRTEPFYSASPMDSYVAADPNDPDSYGLRGDLLYRKKIVPTCAIRHVMLNDAGGMVWESDTSPQVQGIKNTKQISCPNIDSYDANDVCWTYTQ